MSETAEINIAMVGPRGVGKTSLLAAMYNELDPEVRSIECNFTLDAGPTTKAITNRLEELRSLGNKSGIVVQGNEGIDSTSDFREYTFHLDIGDGGAPEVTLRFLDMPGAWYCSEGDYKRADQAIQEAHISFLAVDATALMEAPSKGDGGIGKYHNHINHPDSIKAAYKRALNNFGNGHVIVIVLIRAETYVKSGRIGDLYRQVRVAYGDLASSMQGIPVFACYVETVGSLLFNSFKKEGTHIISEFRRIPGKRYSPQRCALPLRLAIYKGLAHAVVKADQTVKEKDTFINNILSIFIDTDLTTAKEKSERTQQVFEELSGRLKPDDFISISE